MQRFYSQLKESRMWAELVGQLCSGLKLSHSAILVPVKISVTNY